MLARVLLMLVGLVSASLAFSLRSQPTCCSPVEFEALLSASSALGSIKSSQSSSGRLAVDHQHRLAALYLMYPGMDINLFNFSGNATPFSHIADAARTYIAAIQSFVGEHPELVLYIVHEQQQAQQPVQVSPVCKAFILPSIITELGQRCFSSPSQSFLDMIAPNNPATFAFRGTDPTELFAYEMYMSRQGCTPTQASLSSVVSSLEMNFLVSAVSPSISDRSIFNVPAPCAGVTPSRISYPSRGSSGPSSFVQQLVKLYALSQLRPHIQPRQQRSVGDAQQPSVVQDVESILAFEEMLTLVSTVLGDLQNELGGNRGPSFGGRNSPDIEDLIPILVKANILPQILGSVGSKNNQPSIQDIIDALLKSNLVSVGSNSPSVQSLIQTLVKKSLLPSDSSNTDTLVTLLIAENIISSRQEYDALQQLLAEAVALHVIVPHIIHVEMLYNSYQQHQQGPNYQQLMALMALLQGQQQQPSHHLPELIKHENDQSGPDYSQLLQMLLLQQYQASQSQSSGHLPAYIKHQNDNSGPDLSDLLKLLKISS